MSRQKDNFFSRRVAIPTDAHTEKGSRSASTADGVLPSTHHTAQRGGGGGDRGTVVEQSPGTNTYTVHTEHSGIIHGVRRITQSLGDKRILPEGTPVCITYDYGEPMILGVFDYAVDNHDTPMSITGVSGTGSEDPTYQNNDADHRAANTPSDMSANDWAEVSPTGNLIGVLDGGVNVVKSSDLAQIRTHTLNDLVEIFSQTFRHISAMGLSSITNEGGQASYSFRGGVDQLAESGSDQENWTIRFDLGKKGDLLNLNLTKPDGSSVFRFHVSADGKADLFAAKGFHWRKGESDTEVSLGGKNEDIHGDVKQTIRGKHEKEVHGAKSETTSSNASMTVGNDHTHSVVRHQIQTVGGDTQWHFGGGDAVSAKPTNEALSMNVVNGSWTTKIGDPLAGASPAALAGFDLQTFLGDIILNARVKGDVALKTLLGTANLDGTTVNLGPLAVSMANPVLKGTVTVSALTAYLTATGVAYGTITAATTALAAGLPGAVTWIIAQPLLIAWAAAIIPAVSAILAATTALASALPSTLSTKTFTA